MSNNEGTEFLLQSSSPAEVNKLFHAYKKMKRLGLATLDPEKGIQPSFQVKIILALAVIADILLGVILHILLAVAFTDFFFQFNFIKHLFAFEIEASSLGVSVGLVAGLFRMDPTNTPVFQVFFKKLFLSLLEYFSEED